MIDLALLLPTPQPTPTATVVEVVAAAVLLGLRIPTAAESFPEQWAYAISQALLNAVCCSRRAGKTNGAIARAILVLSRENTCVHYVNLIRRNARKQFWYPLLKYLRKLGWKQGRDFTADESEMIIRTRWGSFLQAMSCDSMAGTKAVQGDRSDLFMIDECHLPNDDVLQALVEVAEPMLTDTGGMLDLLGLPPEAEPCFFSEALDNPDWAHFHWTQFDHDFPRPREEKWAFVKERCRKRRLKIDVTEAVNDNGKLLLVLGPDTDPLVAKQYFGKRARDPSKFAYEYRRGLNDYDPRAVDFTKGKWRTGWGIDIGFGDHDAIVVGSTRHDDDSRRIRVRWYWQRSRVDTFALGDLVRCLREVLPPNVIVGDHGGHGGPKTMASLETVLKIKIERKPGEVMLSVRHVNDDFRSARFQLPLQDLYTDKIAAAARRIFAAEPKRLAVVLAMLGVDHEATDALIRRSFADEPEKMESVLELLHTEPASLGTEFGQVVKSVNPRTKKVEINKKGKHSDLSEAGRYMHSGLIRAPGQPAAYDQNRPTAPDELADYELEQERLRERAAEDRRKAQGRY